MLICEGIAVKENMFTCFNTWEQRQVGLSKICKVNMT